MTLNRSEWDLFFKLANRVRTLEWKVMIMATQLEALAAGEKRMAAQLDAVPGLVQGYRDRIASLEAALASTPGNVQAIQDIIDDMKKHSDDYDAKQAAILEAHPVPVVDNPPTPDPAPA